MTIDTNRDAKPSTGAPQDASLPYSNARALLVVSDGPAAATRAEAAARAAGCRVSASVDLAQAVDRLDAQAVTGGVFLELGHSSPACADLDRLLARLDADATAGRYASVVSTPPELVDIVAARAGHASIHQLCGATELDRVAAATLAAIPSDMRFHDSGGGDADANRLRQLTDEVGRIAGALAKLSSGAFPGARPAVPAGPFDASAAPLDAEEIRGMIRARRMRAQFFDPELFADPAWDMLLDLTAAHVDQQRVAVSSLCIAAAVPATTALRWIKTLTDLGIFVRRADPTDGRRVFIELGEDAAKGMRGYLGALRRTADAPGMGLAQMAV